MIPIKIEIKREANIINDFFDSPSETTIISGSNENPFCLPPLSVVKPFLSIYWNKFLILLHKKIFKSLNLTKLDCKVYKLLKLNRLKK